MRAEGLSVRFWGTRGSLPRPGPETVRYGGNTTCLEICVDGRVFILDAGSGIADAGVALRNEGVSRFDILFSHLHHDHVSGLPFFPPALVAGCLIRTYCGNLNGVSAERALDALFTPPLFPIRLSALPCRFEHVGFVAGDDLTFDDVTVRTCALTHPGGATAYRFDHRGRSLCYISDVEHSPEGPDRGLVAFCGGADLVIYDTMFTDKEYKECRGWGHSTLEGGVALCRAAGAKALGATHHHIRHDDAMLDAMNAQLQASFPGSFMAKEGQRIALSKP